MRSWFRKKASLLIRDHVIYADLPDGRNWFQGVREFPLKSEDGKKIVMYANIWTTTWEDVVPGEGIFSKDECKRYIPIIDMDGTFVQFYEEAKYWIEKYPGRFETKPQDHDLWG